MATEKKSNVLPDDIKEDSNSILLNRFECPEIYVDGVSQILLGYPMVKIGMYTVLETGAKEIRKSAVNLAMDTPTALEIAFNIIDSCANVEEGLLQSASSGSIARLKKFLDRIPSVSPGGPSVKKVTQSEPKATAAKSDVSLEATKPVRKSVKKTH